MSCYYILQLPGNLFYNYYASGCADLIAIALNAKVKLPQNRQMQASFAVGLIGALLVMLVGFNSTYLMPLFVLIMRIGLNSVQLNSWVAPMSMFPTLF